MLLVFVPVTQQYIMVRRIKRYYSLNPLTLKPCLRDNLLNYIDSSIGDPPGIVSFILSVGPFYNFGYATFSNEISAFWRCS